MPHYVQITAPTSRQLKLPIRDVWLLSYSYQTCASAIKAIL